MIWEDLEITLLVPFGRAYSVCYVLQYAILTSFFFLLEAFVHVRAQKKYHE